MLAMVGQKAEVRPHEQPSDMDRSGYDHIRDHHLRRPRKHRDNASPAQFKIDRKDPGLPCWIR